MILQVKDIEKQYGEELLFKNLSFTIDEGQKIALVGKNGSGKSTILKIISGNEDSDSGSINLTAGKKIAYLKQEYIGGETVREYLEEDLAEHQYAPVLNSFSLEQDLLDRDMNNLSGGQQSKFMLIKILLSNFDILILDEPTNNLDIPSILWLEEFLKASKKAMIIVSHDIVFIDNVVDRVFELKDKKIKMERGKYSDYIERREKEKARQLKDWKAYEKAVSSIEGNIIKLKEKGQLIDGRDSSDKDKMEASKKRDKASKGQSAIKTMKRRIKRMEKVEKPFEEDPFLLKIVPRKTEGDISIKFEDLFCGYNSTIKIGPFKEELVLGKKLCLMGANGSGKSTFLKTILGDIEKLEGELDKSEGIIFGDLMQQHERADRNKTAIDFFMQETGATFESATNNLKKAGLLDGKMNQKIRGLSSGTRARLLLAVFSYIGANCLILDEPTNHLDMEAVSVIKDLIKEYKGIILLVSHNRWFLNELDIDVFYSIDNGTVEKISNFDKYVVSLQKEAEIMVKRLNRVIR